jgi:hypothetical protein
MFVECRHLIGLYAADAALPKTLQKYEIFLL